MPQTNSRFFDDLSRLMTDAAGLIAVESGPALKNCPRSLQLSPASC